jgi:predicted transcriptional regulator
MATRENQHLTRREQQIMEILYRLGEAGVNEIMDNLPNSPTDGAVRRLLNLLHAKGAIQFRHDAARKVYRPTVARNLAGETALARVVNTFFAGSVSRAVASLFNSSDLELSADERQALLELVDQAKEKGR